MMEEHASPLEVVRRGFALVESLGWRARFPTTTFDSRGDETSPFESQRALEEHIAQVGGLLTLWKGDSDFYFSWFPEGATLGVGFQGNLCEGMDVEARALEEAFAAFCGELAPAYGFSSDDYLLFQFEPDPSAAWNRHLRSIAARESPELLLWLNYFPRRYFEEHVARRLAAVPYRLVPQSHGVLVYLANNPWEARIARLFDGAYQLVPG